MDFSIKIVLLKINASLNHKLASPILSGKIFKMLNFEMRAKECSKYAWLGFGVYVCLCAVCVTATNFTKHSASHFLWPTLRLHNRNEATTYYTAHSKRWMRYVNAKQNSRKPKIGSIIFPTTFNETATQQLYVKHSASNVCSRLYSEREMKIRKQNGRKGDGYMWHVSEYW